jgi:hypothetical protein
MKPVPPVTKTALIAASAVIAAILGRGVRRHKRGEAGNKVGDPPAIGFVLHRARGVPGMPGMPGTLAK